MPALRQLLALGDFSNAERNRIATIGQESAFAIHFENDPSEASRWLDGNAPQALLLDGESAEAQAFALERRAEAKHATLPLLALNKVVTDLAFIEAFSWGADDVIARKDAASIRSRLRHLPKEPTVLPESTRGQVLVADPDHARRLLVGRVLRNAGYQVTFAVQTEDLEQYARSLSPAVIVLNVALTPSPREFVMSLTQLERQPRCVLNCPPRELKKYKAVLDGLSGATATDGFAPAENVLFVSNELGRPRGTDLRASQRLLYGTTVGFRGVGREADDHGFIYNVSEGGLYVRTLAPPDDELVWLELCPPRGERRVRLVGKVAWRRGLTKGEYATVPPGFGVEIIDGARMDIQAWRDGCHSFQSVVD